MNDSEAIDVEYLRGSRTTETTILNAGQTTNFVFQINDLELSEEEIDQINSISTRSKVMDRVDHIKKAGGVFQFYKCQKNVFKNNLILIDSLLPQILSFMVLDFYTSKRSRLVDLVEKITEQNPLKYNTSDDHKFYDYKIKRFLTDIALGMMPVTVWTGQYDATGGYLVVKESGEVLCYHIYNRNEFENYLFNNTRFETASSTRHEFGKIYWEDGEFFFKLNLQIRFIQ
ncbi:MAG: HpaII family restriction endonuclease [Nonlabens sp.]